MLVLRKVAAAFVSFLLIIVIFFLLFVSHAGAQQANNIYGIHITDKEDIPLAAKLVNGESGEWGYVTIVIQSDDRKIDKWQPIFHDLILYKLQPIVRLATKVDGNTWTRPRPEDAQEWATFLDALYWPTDQRIVSIYNETNHGREWGGTTDPADYARVLDATIQALRQKNSAFFILQGAFDQSTPQEPPAYFDQLRYMEEMEKAVPGIFTKLDGWASHSYPNPGFAGRPTDTGRGTIRGYEWELEQLRSRFGVTKSLPVYIKETGWPYKDDLHPRQRYDLETVADYTAQAFEQVWSKDTRVVAVTPFLLRYKAEAFSHFSWLLQDNSLSPLYSRIAEMPKAKGQPKLSYRAVIDKIAIPSQVPFDREVMATISYRNVGSQPWTATENVTLTVTDPQQIITRNNFVFTDPATRIMPGQTFTYRFQVKAQQKVSTLPLTLQMRQNGSAFGEKLYTPLSLYQLPVIEISTENPPSEAIDGVIVGMKDARGTAHIFESVQLPANGQLGSFEHPSFLPGVPLNVVVSIPRRDQVSMVLTPTEGTNALSITLPREKSGFVLFAETFARSLRRN